MKPIRFSIILALLLSSVLFVEKANAQFRVGVRGGFDVISNKLDLNIIKAKNRLGYQVGPVVEFISPASGFGVDAGLLYGRKEYKIDDKEADISISDFDYISIPLNLKKRFGLGPLSPVGIFISAGVYGDVKVGGGKVHIADVIDDYKTKNFIFGLNAGAGVSLLGHLDVGMYYRRALTDKYGDEHFSEDIFQNKKNEAWSVALTYFF
ncbi:porin family protein [Dysgonomonas sp. 511]|uniref:porin family protein n=1 Tax=Dysgonomonas sp. 511 TaxID=2302930 RepID=UPI0013D3ADD0|nr:porin family protein [Dysgonomonas sp. 511]NDV79026.1 porin family protein [Dysgonomonas sp. 511]